MKRPLLPSHGHAEMNKSSFEATLCPLKGEEEASRWLDEAKKAFPKADHYPYAYVLGQKSKSSDDGEPGGTGGRPLLELLSREGIDGALLVVARYFGGAKLGTGNLRRCFIEAGKQAIASARFGEETKIRSYEMEVDYSAYQSLEKMAPRLGYEIAASDFGERVRVRLESAAPLEQALQSLGFREGEIPAPAIRIVYKEK